MDPSLLTLADGLLVARDAGEVLDAVASLGLRGQGMGASWTHLLVAVGPHGRGLPLAGRGVSSGNTVSFSPPFAPEAWHALTGRCYHLLPSSGGPPSSFPPPPPPWDQHLAQASEGATEPGIWRLLPLLPDGDDGASPLGVLAIRLRGSAPPDDARCAPLDLLARLTTLALLRVRKRADAEAVHRRHADLFHSVPIPLFVASDGGRILEANPAFEALFGVSIGPEMGEGIWLTHLHQDPESCAAWLAEVRAGQAVDARRVPLLAGDGSEVTAEISAAARTAPGGGLLVEGAIRDVTGQIEAEREAHIFTSALVQTDGAVCIADAGGRIRFVNPSFEAMTGYRSSELLGRNLEDLSTPAEARMPGEVRSESLERLLSGEVVRGERTAVRADGGEYTEARTVTPIRDARGRITHLISVSRDITASRKLERQFHQAQKLEAVGRLAGGVAHDFNNLLTVIQGHVQMILMQLDPDSPIRGDLEGMVQAGNRAGALVQQLLTFARREPELVSTPLDLGAVLGAMESLLQRLVGEDMELVVEVEAGLPLVEIDRSRLEQILANLVVNARDAMPEGGTVHLRSWGADGTVPGGGRHLFLSVRDTGTGIPLHLQERIFEPFFTTKKDGDGSGLGLATVYGIVRQAGGTVQVTSAPGEGATFLIQLPEAASRSHLHEEGTDLPPDLLADHRGSERILLVEDHDLVRNITRSILRDQGYSVDEATTGEEALQLLRDDAEPVYDLVITDLLMRGMGGERLAATLRAQNPEYPILFISGYRGSDAQAQVEIAGPAIDVIPKPFTVPELIGAVRRVLELSLRKPR